MSSLQSTAILDITQESLSEYLRSRYPDRSFDDFSRLLDELIVELRSGGFSTIGELDKALQCTRKAAECFEVENPPSEIVGSRYSAIGIVKISIELLRGNGFFLSKTVLDNRSPEELDKYRKLVLR